MPGLEPLAQLVCRVIVSYCPEGLLRLPGHVWICCASTSVRVGLDEGVTWKIRIEADGTQNFRRVLLGQPCPGLDEGENEGPISASLIVPSEKSREFVRLGGLIVDIGSL